MLSVTERKNCSFYLAFKQFPPFVEFEQVPLKTSGDIHDYLKTQIPEDAGLMLSSGRDSAILASLMPKGSIAYSVRCEGRRDETIFAAQLAKKLKLQHKIITMTKADYRGHIFDGKSPISFCPWTYKVAKQAKADGCKNLVSGTGTLACFGEDAHFHDLANDADLFLRKWAVIWPPDILKEAYPLKDMVRKYIRDDNSLDTIRFMSLDRGARVTMDYSVELAGLCHITPFHKIATPLDIERAKREGKYLLAELYEKIYKEKPQPKRSPSVINYEEWFKDYTPNHLNFWPNLPKVDGIRKWMLYKLEHHWRRHEKDNSR